MKLALPKKREFRPDRRGGGQLSKLWPTPKQQLRILRWLLYGLICLVGLVAQDVLFYRLRIGGACTDLVPCLIMMVAVAQGAQSSCIFVLIAAALYFFSGSSVGVYVIALLTFTAVSASIFRQAFLRRGFFSMLLCVGGGMLLYELALFGISLFLRLNVWAKLGDTLLTVAMSMAAASLVYPILLAVGKLGGEPWEE